MNTYESVLAMLLVLLVGVALLLLVRKPGNFDKLNRFVENMASTNWKMVTSIVMALGTMLFYFGSELRCLAYKIEGTCRPIDTTNFGLWLGFVAAWAGITVKQFQIKRDTYAVPSPDSERAGVPTSPPPAVPSQLPSGGGKAGTPSPPETVLPLPHKEPEIGHD